MKLARANKTGHFLLNSFNIHKHIIISSIFFCFFLGDYYIDIGFALKPYMIALILISFCAILARAKLTICPSDLLFVGLIFYSGLNLIFSENMISELRLLFGLILMLIILVLMKWVLTFSLCSRNDALRAMVHSSYIFITVSFFMYLRGLFLIDFNFEENLNTIGVMVDRGVPRLTGLLSDPNFFVLYASFIFFYLLLKKRCIYEHIILVLTFLTILLSFSWGGIVGIFAGCIFSFFWSRKNLKNFYVKLLYASFLTLGILILFVVFDSDHLLYQFVRKRLYAALDGSGRWELWRAALDLWAANPVFGNGLFSFRRHSLATNGTDTFIHNTFLEVIVDLGIVGLIMFLIWILTWLIKSSKHFARNPNLSFYCPLLFSWFVQINGISVLVNEFLFLNLALLSAVSQKIRSPDKLENLDFARSRFLGG